jgi:chromate reductase, NAD(P)H dehydrogenase (quinone)
MKEHYIIISGTDRKGSNTHKVAVQYQQLLEQFGIGSSVVSLESLDLKKGSAGYSSIETEFLRPFEKFIFISPEYNGSFPGVLKTMLDISDYKNVWWGKKALLVGVSTGRSGNVRGMEHLTSILHYLKVVVHPNKLPISSVDKLLNGAGSILDNDTIKAMKVQLDEFIRF